MRRISNVESTAGPRVRSSIGPIAGLVVGAIALALAGCSGGNDQELAALKAEAQAAKSVAANLAEFDTLDYTVFTNQEWSRFHESHAHDIRVVWPDGHVTVGLDTHIVDLKRLFVYAPDTRIKEHPIRIGSGKYTAVTGVFEGTFTKPMPLGGGKFIQPTGKAFRMPMATVGIWEDGVMVEEHLFWDNQTYMQQIGLAK